MTGGKKFEEILDPGMGVAYDAHMNFTTDPAALRDLARRNAKAKRTIQAKRSRDAKVNAATKGIKHDHFPTYYKYG